MIIRYQYGVVIFPCDLYVRVTSKCDDLADFTVTLDSNDRDIYSHDSLEMCHRMIDKITKKYLDGEKLVYIESLKREIVVDISKNHLLSNEKGKDVAEE